MSFHSNASSSGPSTHQNSNFKFDERLHFGAKKFLGELRDSESVWSLMVDSGGGLPANGTRICPIFVFSLKGLADPCLVDGRGVSQTLGEGSVVITGSSSEHLTPNVTTNFLY